MIIHIFKTKVFSLHLIKQEIGLELDARSWFFTYFWEVSWLNFGLVSCSLVTIKQMPNLGSESSFLFVTAQGIWWVYTLDGDFKHI